MKTAESEVQYNIEHMCKAGLDPHFQNPSMTSILIGSGEWLTIKGFLYWESRPSSGSLFESSGWGCSHGSLQIDWNFFPISISLKHSVEGSQPAIINSRQVKFNWVHQKLSKGRKSLPKFCWLVEVNLSYTILHYTCTAKLIPTTIRIIQMNVGIKLFTVGPFFVK